MADQSLDSWQSVQSFKKRMERYILNPAQDNKRKTRFWTAQDGVSQTFEEEALGPQDNSIFLNSTYEMCAGQRMYTLSEKEIENFFKDVQKSHKILDNMNVPEVKVVDKTLLALRAACMGAALTLVGVCVATAFGDENEENPQHIEQDQKNMLTLPELTND